MRRVSNSQYLRPHVNHLAIMLKRSPEPAGIVRRALPDGQMKAREVWDWGCGGGGGVLVFHSFVPLLAHQHAGQQTGEPASNNQDTVQQRRRWVDGAVVHLYDIVFLIILMNTTSV